MVKKNILIIAGNFKEKFGKYEFGISPNNSTEELEDAFRMAIEIKTKYKDKISIDLLSDNNSDSRYEMIVDKRRSEKYVDRLKLQIRNLVSEKKYDLVLDFSTIPNFKIEGFKLDGTDNKYMGDTLLSDYEKTVIGLRKQDWIYEDSGIAKKIKFDYNAKKRIPGYDVVVTKKILSLDTDVESEKVYITEDEMFVDLSTSDLLEDLIGLFDRKIKYLASTETVPCVTFSNDTFINETESIKSGNVTVIKKDFIETYISAVLEQNDSNDEYSKYVFCSTGIDEQDVLLHEMHVKTGRNRIVSSNKDNAFTLGIPSKIVTKDTEILDFIDGEINAVQSLNSLWNLDGTKRISGSRLYKFDNNSIGSDCLEAVYDKNINKFIISSSESDNIGTMELVIKCDENSTISEVEFGLNIEEQGHHVIEAILKTFADITVVAKQEQLADFLIDKYGFERREDGAAIRKMA